MVLFTRTQQGMDSDKLRTKGFVCSWERLSEFIISHICGRGRPFLRSWLFYLAILLSLLCSVSEVSQTEGKILLTFQEINFEERVPKDNANWSL